MSDLNFIYTQVARHDKVMAIGNGPLIREVLREDGRSADDEPYMEKIEEDFIKIQGNKLTKVAKNANNAKVMAELVQAKLFKPFGEETVEYMEKYLKVQAEKNDGKQSKLEKAIEEKGKVVKDWHHATIKSVAEELEVEGESSEEIIVKIQDLIDE